MEPQRPSHDNSKAMDYVRSLKDSIKRRYADEYLKWIRDGRLGSAPNRGSMSLTLWKGICANLDALA